jgi:hypothetical protein
MNSGASTIAFVVAVILAWFGFASRKPEIPRPVGVAVIEALSGSNDALKQYEEQQRKERESLDEFRTTAPYREARSITIDPAYGKILGFCSLGEGRLAAVTGQADAYGAVVDTHDPATVGNRLVWLSADGREERSVPLDFSPRAVNPGPDGSLWVVGGSNVAHFAADGEKLAAADAPHFTLSPEGREEFVEEVKTRHAAEIESYKQSMKMQEEMVAELEGKKEGDPGYQPEEMVKLYKQSCDSMKAHVESRQNMTEEQVVDEAIERVRQIHRVAVTAEHVFLVTNQDVGHGFAIWRCTSDLADPVRIVEGLAGCCGQMDVQVVEGGLAIAENSRHHVRLVDFDGEEIRTFGETSMADITKGFGGCCNPMNTCLDGDGCLLTSESNGLVKRYSLDGEFKEVVGVADVQAGCKNSSIGMSTDGSHLYYLDVHKGTVVVLEKAG